MPTEESCKEQKWFKDRATDMEKHIDKMFKKVKSSKDVFPLDCPIIPIKKDGDK